jgi:hypothetical protein
MSSVTASTTGSGTGAADDDEAMQAAFAAFMLGGKTQQQQVSSPSPSSSQSPRISQTQSFFNKALRKYQPIVNACHGTLVRDWLEVDDNLAQVMHSIANLRERCWLTSRLLVKQEQASRGGIRNIRASMRSRGSSDSSSSSNSNSNPWKGHGFRMDPQKTALPGDDLELALSHDLLQHERMLSGARKLIHSLGEAQDALGRRLDELLWHHMDTYRLLDDSITPEGSLAFEGAAVKVDECQQLYSQTSRELYRKQHLAVQVLDSVQDTLLFREKGVFSSGGGDGDDVSRTPRGVALRVADQWPRTHRESHLYASSLWLRDLMRANGNGNAHGSR